MPQIVIQVSAPDGYDLEEIAGDVQEALHKVPHDPRYTFHGVTVAS